MYRIWNIREDYDADYEAAFASMAILCAMGAWNNMLWPMLVFRDTNKFTLPIGLNTLLDSLWEQLQSADCRVYVRIIPILIIYLIFNRYLVEGMTSGAVKGYDRTESYPQSFVCSGIKSPLHRQKCTSADFRLP